MATQSINCYALPDLHFHPIRHTNVIAFLIFLFAHLRLSPGYTMNGAHKASPSISVIELSSLNLPTGGLMNKRFFYVSDALGELCK